MATDYDLNPCDSLPLEDSIPSIRTIPIQINKLRMDKGKLKAQDAEAFKCSATSKLLEIQHPEKRMSENNIANSSDWIIS